MSIQPRKRKHNMKKNPFFIKLTWAALALVMAFTACSNLLGNSAKEADKTALNEAIVRAEGEKLGVTVASSAANVPLGTQWVMPSQMAVFEAALNDAKLVRDNGSAAQSQADAAVDQLNNAIAVFINAKQFGTGPGGQLSAPAGLQVTNATANSISLSWNYVDSAFYYNVYRSSSPDGYYSLITGYNYSAFYTDYSVSAGATYYYRVAAVSSGGSESPQSGYISGTTTSSGGFPPSSSTSLTLDAWADGTLSAGQAQWYSFTAASAEAYAITWNDSNLNSGKTCDIKVSAYASGGTPIFSEQDIGNASPQPISGQSGTIYLKVEGHNPSSSGAYAIKYSQSSLAAPAGLQVTNATANSISLSWNYVDSAFYYNVYRSSNPDGYYSLITGYNYSASYTDYSVSAGATYYYRVSAYNSAEKESGQSPYASATTLTLAPTGVTAAAQSSSSIEVSWSWVSGASGYSVYRAASSYGSYSYIGYASTNSYTDTGLGANTTYYYRVSAYNSAREESGQSSYASATTLPPPEGTLAITVGFNLGAITIGGSNGTNFIRKTGAPNNLELKAVGYTGVAWHVDGGTPSSGDTLVINASAYPAQPHSVTFTGFKDGAYYSQLIPFTVVN
jgi:fibronectin type 3 domain-containing protein